MENAKDKQREVNSPSNDGDWLRLIQSGPIMFERGL
jgi:hypothetical protein